MHLQPPEQALSPLALSYLRGGRDTSEPAHLGRGPVDSSFMAAFWSTVHALVL